VRRGALAPFITAIGELRHRAMMTGGAGSIDGVSFDLGRGSEAAQPLLEWERHGGRPEG
jgi:hypothetical protein